MDPQYEGRAYDNDDPVLETQAADIEELLQTGQLYHDHLSHKDDGHDGQQHLAALEVERAASRFKGTGTEEVEEMGHHEDGEE